MFVTDEGFANGIAAKICEIAYLHVRSARSGSESKSEPESFESWLAVAEADRDPGGSRERHRGRRRCQGSLSVRRRGVVIGLGRWGVEEGEETGTLGMID